MNSSLRKKLSVLSCALISLASVRPYAMAAPDWDQFKAVLVDKNKAEVSPDVNAIRLWAKKVAMMYPDSEVYKINNKGKNDPFLKWLKDVGTGSLINPLESWPELDDHWDDLANWDPAGYNVGGDLKAMWETAQASMANLGLVQAPVKEFNINMVDDEMIEPAKNHDKDEAPTPQGGQKKSSAPKKINAPKTMTLPSNLPASKPASSTPSSDSSTPAGEAGMSLGKKVLIAGGVVAVSAIIATVLYAKVNGKWPFAPGNQTSLIKH